MKDTTFHTVVEKKEGEQITAVFYNTSRGNIRITGTKDQLAQVWTDFYLESLDNISNTAW